MSTLGTERMHLRAVLLDIDGTLVDSNDAHAASWSEACAAYGYERPPEFFRPLIGMGGDHVLPRIDAHLSDETEPGTAIAARRGEVFTAKYLPGLTATPGARELVERIKGRGLRCIVASSAKEDELDALLDVAGIREMMDERTTSDDAEVTKPAPDIVVTALQKGDVAPSDVLLLGDTPHDIESAKRAGVGVIAFRCGGWNDEGLSGALQIYDDPADLVVHFEESLLGRGAASR